MSEGLQGPTGTQRRTTAQEICTPLFSKVFSWFLDTHVVSSRNQLFCWATGNFSLPAKLFGNGGWKFSLPKLGVTCTLREPCGLCMRRKMVICTIIAPESASAALTQMNINVFKDTCQRVTLCNRRYTCAEDSLST